AALSGVPQGIDLCSSVCLSILKIRGLSVQNIDIPGLVNIEFRSHLRPERVIHPYPCDSVAVRDEIAVPVSDDRCVCSVDPYSAEVFLYHLSHSAGIHEKERETVLPEIPPSPSASSVIVMGQERTS